MGWFGNRSSDGDVESLEARVAQLEEMVAAQQQIVDQLRGQLCVSVGADVTFPVVNGAITGSGAVDLHDIRAEIAAGRKIQAIKMYRDRTGADLRTAKQFVESLGAGPR